MGTCALCGEDAVVMINGNWYCTDHIDQGFRAALDPIREALQEQGE